MNDPATHLYRGFGMQIESYLELPGLAPASGNATEDRKIRISPGPAPTALAGSRRVDDRCVVTGDEALVEISGTARFFVRNGTEVHVQSAPGATDEQLRYHLVGLVLGVLLLQQGRVALHASAIEVNDRALGADRSCVAFAGASTAGKSTVAAWLAGRGHPLICDDACVVELVEEPGGSRVEVWPGSSRVKVDRASLGALGIPHQLLKAVEGPRHRVYLPAPRVAGEPARLDALYVISTATGSSTPTIDRVKGLAALRAVRGNMHGMTFLGPLGTIDRSFKQCAAILDAVPIYSAPIRRGLDILDDEFGRVEAHMQRLSRG